MRFCFLGRLGSQANTSAKVCYFGQCFFFLCSWAKQIKTCIIRPKKLINIYISEKNVNYGFKLYFFGSKQAKNRTIHTTLNAGLGIQTGDIIQERDQKPQEILPFSFEYCAPVFELQKHPGKLQVSCGLSQRFHYSPFHFCLESFFQL